MRRRRCRLRFFGGRQGAPAPSRSSRCVQRRSERKKNPATFVAGFLSALGELFRAFYIVTRCSKPLKTVIFDFHSVQNRGVLPSTFIYLVRQICGKIICYLKGKRENFAYIKYTAWGLDCQCNREREQRREITRPNQRRTPEIV